MAIEIGSLVVRGSFGSEKPSEMSEETFEELLDRVRVDVLEDVREILAEAERRARER